jgi:hypothetical protein
VFLGEFGFDDRKCQVQKEEGSNEDERNEKDDGKGRVGYLNCCHGGGPTFEGHTSEDGYQRVKDCVKVSLVEVRILEGLSTVVAWGAVNIAAEIIIWMPQACVYVDASPF